MNFGIIEVGSTNTKAYIYDNGKLIDKGLKHIAFKDNYKISNCLSENDITDLYDLIKKIKKDVNMVYIFGTSIFRKIPKLECDSFITRLKNDLGVDFKVVSADDEAYYTVRGVIGNIDYDKKMGVVIGGGGSTEIAITENKKIIERLNLDFGAMDITDEFPELKEDYVKTDFNTILNYTMSLIANLNEKVDVLVLAGGDYIYFYQKAGYKMDNNFLYNDDNQPYLLDFETLNNYDKDILNKSLIELKKQNSDNANWWDGARGMRFCMNAVARKLKAKYIIPTRINMLLGLVEEIKNNMKQV